MNSNNRVFLNYLSGLFLASSVALAAILFEAYVQTQIGSITIAILIGVLIGNTISYPERCNLGLAFAEKKLLVYAIALLGLGLKLDHLALLGSSRLLALGLMVLLLLFLTPYVAKLFAIPAPLAGLLAIGSAICGASAIAIAASLLKSKKEDLAISMSVINILGLASLIILPIFLGWYGGSEALNALIIGGSMPAIGHVVAAGYAFNETTGETALTIKMARVLFLIPLVLFLSFWKTTENAQSNPFKIIPFYIYGFILMVIIGNLDLINSSITVMLKELSHILLVVAMAAIGLNIKFTDLKSNFSRSLLLGGLLLFVQVVYLFAVVVVG